MGIIDSKNLLTATESIKPKNPKPYSKRKKNPFAKQFKLTDRNASENHENDAIRNAKPVTGGKKVLTDKNADCRALVNEASKKFQTNYLDYEN